MDFSVTVDHIGKIKEGEKIDKYCDLAREVKKNKMCVHESYGDSTCSWCTFPKAWTKDWNEIESPRKNRDHPDQSIVKISDCTQKSPGDQRRLAVSQIPVKDHQLTLV